MANSYDRMKCTVWLSVLVLLVGLEPIPGAFVIHPSDVAVVEGQETQLSCKVHLNGTPAEWYLFTSPSTKFLIEDGFQNRFFVRVMGATSVLFINDTSPMDSGVYSCESGDSVSENATLRVLPKIWNPRCVYNRKGPVEAGGRLEILCISKGDSETKLRWMRNNDVISGVTRSVNGSSVFLHANIVISDEAEVFICEASLANLQVNEICLLRPAKTTERSLAAQYVAYAVVIFLSIVVVVLFVVMIVVILRQRQCRYFHRTPPQPQTVLDMDQLQSGLGPPRLTTLQSGDRDTDSVGSASDLVQPGSGGPPPDVVPTGHRVGSSRQRTSSPSSTLRRNMDTNIDQEKPGTKTPKIQSPTNDRRGLEGINGLDSTMELRTNYEDIGDVSLGPNLLSTSNDRTLDRNNPSTYDRLPSNIHDLPSTSSSTAQAYFTPSPNGANSDPDRPSTSTDMTTESPPLSNGTTLKKNKDRLNDLGTLKKERMYKKRKVANRTDETCREDDQLDTGDDSVNNLDSISLNIEREEEE